MKRWKRAKKVEPKPIEAVFTPKEVLGALHRMFPERFTINGFPETPWFVNMSHVDGRTTITYISAKEEEGS